MANPAWRAHVESTAACPIDPPGAAMIAVVRRTALLVALAAGLPAQVPTLPNETPAKVAPTYDGFDYARREVMIPMRDGVKLHTVVLVPKGVRNAPILMTRTP